MKLIIYHVKHMNLQIACADHVSQIENWKAINRHIYIARYSAWFILLFNSKKPYYPGEPRDAT